MSSGRFTSVYVTNSKWDKKEEHGFIIKNNHDKSMYKRLGDLPGFL